MLLESKSPPKACRASRNFPWWGTLTKGSLAKSRVLTSFPPIFPSTSHSRPQARNRPTFFGGVGCGSNIYRHFYHVGTAHLVNFSTRCRSTPNKIKRLIAPEGSVLRRRLLAQEITPGRTGACDLVRASPCGECRRAAGMATTGGVFLGFSWQPGG